MSNVAIGIYEELVTKLVSQRLAEIDRDKFFINETKIDKTEASRVLSTFLSTVIKLALSLITGDNAVEKQIELSNKIIYLLRDELKDFDFESDIVQQEGRLLNAILDKVNNPFADFEKRLRQITPYTGLSYCELFTGSNAGISMESEIRKEILSSNKIQLLVSFIKFTGIRVFEKELIEFTEAGGILQIITTAYMGATDLKAVEFLSGLKNTEIKVSYNTDNERLHAKAYLFLRNSGFHTGYIGSSNMSRSALTNGLEWNLKVTTKELGHIIKKFQNTFDTYWLDHDFEYFRSGHDTLKLKTALHRERHSGAQRVSNYFDLKPFPFQEEILEKLKVEREGHHRFKNLVVAATGTGKTVISAFDFKRYKASNSRARLLFVSHRKEILQQAQSTFQGVLKDNNFGELWVDGLVPDEYSNVFASVQTVNNQLKSLGLSETFYDFIIIDEVHHIAANSYRPILEHFKPAILLGLTATPERNDGQDILSDFCGTIAAEIRLPEAINRRLLCPFQYFGITDRVDLSQIDWKRGRYEPSELTRVYTQNDDRVRDIISNLDKYITDINDVRALGFCVSQEHALYMAEKFTLNGLKADVLTSINTSSREEIRRRLESKAINYLFVVDIFNEGIDIPEIDTVLFLRPTESLTIFLQQLGRGLRLAEGKDCLTVLDFVGNARSEYDFESKFRALIGKTLTSIQKELEADFPHPPLGCSIVLEKKARQYILDNIRNATQSNRKQLQNKILNFSHQTSLPLTLKNFCSFYHLPLQAIYKNGLWRRLLVDANQLKPFHNTNEAEILRAISKKWLSCSSTSYFTFILEQAKAEFRFSYSSATEEQRSMALMLHYDVWQNAGGFKSLEDSIRAIGKNKVLIEEIIELLEYRLDEVAIMEKEITLPYAQPLKVHGRYTRDQIMAAFGDSTFDKKSSNREGIADLKNKNTELLLITLNKSTKDYSPTTLYEDFAVNESLFHWQSQNATSVNSIKGRKYLEHVNDKKRMLLFVREQNDDEFGNTMSYVFLGDGTLRDYYGSKPISINWQLSEPMPAFLWKSAGKMAVG